MQKDRTVNATCYESKCNTSELRQKYTFRKHGEIIVIMGRWLEWNILFTQAVITDMAKSIFEVLKKKGGGDGTSWYSAMLS